MKIAALVPFAAVVAAGAPALAKAPELRLDNVAAHVRIIPEPRGDFAVSVANAPAGLPPIRLSRTPQGLVLEGGLRGRIRGCLGRSGLRIKDGPRLSEAQLPQITIRAPLDFTVRSNGAVNGEVGPARAVDLHAEGCGRWEVGDTSDRLSVAFEGLGRVRAGRARAANLSLEGLGNIEVASVSGPTSISVEGLGGVTVRGGHASSLSTSLDGLGHIDFAGVADSLSASASGMGSIHVAEVRGPVQKSQDGFARIRIGR